MRLDALDAACRRGVSAGAFPGAVVLVGNSAGILCHRAYGHRALAPERLPMMPDTVFDLSSLTKPMATTTAMMLLVRDGRVRLDDPACTVIPEFGRGARAAVTFRQLLNHTSGLAAWKPYYETVIPVTQGVSKPHSERGNDPQTRHSRESGNPGGAERGNTAPAPLQDPWIPAFAGMTERPFVPRSWSFDTPWKAGIQRRRGATAALPKEITGAHAGTHAVAGKSRCLERVHDEELVAPPGEKHLYSDLGFILLGEAIERLGGRPLDRFCQDEIFAPLGLASTFFVDLSGSAPEPRPRAGRTIAATEDCARRRKILCGEVHDDNAYAMGGVAGHAGVFSSAPDVHRFLRFLGRCYEDAEPDFLPGAVVREFLDAERTLPGQTHVLGWDTPSPQRSSSGRHFSARTVGHLGFTGTSIWWDLERDVHVVFLTNRVHPSRDNAAIREYRPLVHDAVMEGLST